MSKKPFYLGLDIGTDSVGYAVTDTKYNILKFHGEPAWGSTIFEPASFNSERRGFRTSRKNIDRKKQRVGYVQDFFAEEIVKKDPRFFVRLQESALYRDEVNDQYILFNDEDYSDANYHNEYPTIHHLIQELMNNEAPHDVRLVYLTCAWLVSHRGHFLSNIDINNLDKIKDFQSVYTAFLAYFADNGYTTPWECTAVSDIGNALKEKTSITVKNKKLVAVLFDGKKPGKTITEEFPYSREAMVKLLSGGTCKLKDLFGKEEYEEFGSVSLGMDDDKLGEIMTNIGDDFDIIAELRSLFDWATLVDVLGKYSTISEAKVAIYNQHKKDLQTLKYFIRKYVPNRYDDVFRAEDKDNYVAYTYHTNDGNTSSLKKKTIEVVSKYLLQNVKDIIPTGDDAEKYQDMIARLETDSFLQKQKNTSNRVIPYQLYAYELKCILENASKYLPFLNKEDENGLTVKDKVYSVFTFKIPYFVGPLNAHSQHAWLERKAGKIYPWNFEEMVDLDVSEQNFIQRMTNRCTYIPGEPVLPKDSLLYHQFMVLNEINNIRINREKISVELKQRIYNELFLNVKKITRKKLIDFLICNGELEKGKEDLLTGVDITINSNLSSQIAFRQLLDKGILSTADVEKIIERASYAEDKTRLSKWLEKEFPQVDDTDRRYICRVKIKDFGRLSRAFLCELEGANKKTGEIMTIIGALWNTQNNLMELLSDEFTFMEKLKEIQRDYYAVNPVSLSDRMNEMYISNSVRRSVYRTLAIVKDVEKAFGVPEKIFVEMARGGAADQKGKRTKTRKQQILDLYALCKDEDVKHLKRQLDDMGEYAENRLQGDKLFLYYMQLGRCMYSGEPIELEKLGTKLYDIDHIYPQAFVKDDSIINNKVLVLSTKNGEKSDKYPIASDIRHAMKGFWSVLKDKQLISAEKYSRLVRNTPFTEEEKYGFINRQIVETSQSTKAVATILGEKYPDTEIVYCKARLTSEFRQEFDIWKSRTINDLHHAVDAYLNIVTGNVYSMKFTKKWFSPSSNYSVKTKTLFTRPLICDGVTVWDGEEMLKRVKKTATKNTAHLTKFAYFKHGGFFDQMPVPKSNGLVPRKKGLDPERYGGYNKAGVMFYIPTKYKLGKKTEVIIMSVEMLVGDRFLADKEFAIEYAYQRLEHILGKKVNEISFPMGMRPWKVNTVLSLDGYKVCISGIGSGGKCLIAQPFTPFLDNPFWNFYLKKLEAYLKKITENAKYVYSEEYDHISVLKNIELYDLYLHKYRNTIFRHRVNAPIDTLEKGRKRFVSLEINDQVRMLMNIHQTFGRTSSGGVDLKAIGGAGKTGATVNFSSSISNWKKKYTDVRIIDSSVTGLWTKTSDINLLELV